MDKTNISLSLTDEYGGTRQDTKVVSNSITDVRDILDRLNRADDMDMEPEMGMEPDLRNMGNTGLGGMDDMSMGGMGMNEPEMEPEIVPGSEVMDTVPVEPEDHEPYGAEPALDVSKPAEPIDVSIDDDGTLSLDDDIDFREGMFDKVRAKYGKGLDTAEIKDAARTAMAWTNDPLKAIEVVVKKYGPASKKIASEVVNGMKQSDVRRIQMDDSIDPELTSVEEGVADFVKDKFAGAFGDVKKAFPMFFELKGINKDHKWTMESMKDLETVLSYYGMNQDKKDIISTVASGITWNNDNDTMFFSPASKKDAHVLRQSEENNEDPIEEDCGDFDYREEDSGPNDPNSYSRERDLGDFAKKGHSKKNLKRGGAGDNTLPEADEVFESQMLKDWENFKSK